MSAGPYDSTSEAPALPKHTNFRARCAPRDSLRRAGPPDILSWFLAELRTRRAFLKRSIEMLNREAAARNLAIRPLAARKQNCRQRNRPHPAR